MAGGSDGISGRPGEAPAYAGTDFLIARDGRIAALYLFFDKLSWTLPSLQALITRSLSVSDKSTRTALCEIKSVSPCKTFSVSHSKARVPLWDFLAFNSVEHERKILFIRSARFRYSIKSNSLRLDARSVAI